jgi:hypothetical protein
MLKKLLGNGVGQDATRSVSIAAPKVEDVVLIRPIKLVPKNVQQLLGVVLLHVMGFRVQIRVVHGDDLIAELKCRADG